MWAFAACVLNAMLYAQTNASAPQDAGSISGRVISPGGQAVRKATVTARGTFTTAPPAGQLPQLPTYSASTDADGRFTLQGLTPGNYTISVEHPNYLRTNYGAPGNAFSASSMVHLTAGQNMNDANVTMIAQSTISGRIVDEDGEPAPRVAVLALRRIFGMNARGQYLANARATTDENGDYKLTNLPAGRYIVSAAPAVTGVSLQNMRRPAADVKKVEEAAIVTFYPGMAHIGEAIPIEVAAGQDKDGTNLRLLKAPVYAVRGKAIGDIQVTGTSRLRVAVMPADLGMGISLDKTAFPDKDGSFEIRGVGPGAYTVVAMNANGMIQVLASQSIQVGSEDVNNVVLQASPPVDLQGIVRTDGVPKQQNGGMNAPSGQGQDATKNPSYRIALLPLDALRFSTPPMVTAKQDGTFTIERVTAGTWQVIVNSLGQGGGYVKSIRLSGREMIDSGLVISPGAAGPLEIVMSTDGGEIDGTVKGSDGNPAPRGLIALVPETAPGNRPDLYKQGVSSDNGVFRLMNVPPGKYRVYSLALADAGVQYDPDVLKQHESGSERVTVEAGGTVQVALTR